MKRAILHAEKVITCHLTASEPHQQVLEGSHFRDQMLQFQMNASKSDLIEDVAAI